MLTTNKAIYFLFLAIALLMIFCAEDPKTAFDQSRYENLNPDVSYVGMQTCKTCHANIHETFKETGMGKSFDHASRQKSAASYTTHDIVYHAASNFYYKPYFQDSTLYIKEFRLNEDGDTTHQRIEQISYIIGSGQHTNSHIIEENGYIYQAPITYYTQEKHWDMAPGYADGNLRFSRLLAAECITCHNHLPQQVEGSMNKFVEMPRGIECERCHGPGERHVADKSEGIIVDTSQFIDYSIVNPRDLPRDLQMDLCQRCHLQGVAVLEEGKSFYDFRPGMKLSEVFNVFLPRYTDTHEKFIMASQADRLRMSPCYQLTEEMSCLTCHNPHHSIETTAVSQFNNACKSCHQTQKVKLECSVSIAERLKVEDNCVSCHMPGSGSIDIPHVNITDHYISKQTAHRGARVNQEQKSKIADFLGLEMLTKDQPSPLDMAKGYLALYDKYVDSSVMLDSAAYYLQRSKATPEQQFKTRIHYHFTRQQYAEVIKEAKTLPLEKVSDGWTSYRIGESYYKSGDFALAKNYFERATEYLPFHLDFQEKLGLAYANLRMLKEAEEVFTFVLKENPKRPVALSNLGFLQVVQQKFKEGEELYDRAIALDPDYEQALLNKAAILIQRSAAKEAIEYLERVLLINPANQQAQLALDQLNG